MWLKCPYILFDSTVITDFSFFFLSFSRLSLCIYLIYIIIIYFILFFYIFWERLRRQQNPGLFGKMITSASTRFGPEDADGPHSDPDEDEEEELQLQIP